MLVRRNPIKFRLIRSVFSFVQDTVILIIPKRLFAEGLLVGSVGVGRKQLKHELKKRQTQTPAITVDLSRRSGNSRCPSYWPTLFAPWIDLDTIQFVEQLEQALAIIVHLRDYCKMNFGGVIASPLELQDAINSVSFLHRMVRGLFISFLYCQRIWSKSCTRTQCSILYFKRVGSYPVGNPRWHLHCCLVEFQ